MENRRFLSLVSWPVYSRYFVALLLVAVATVMKLTLFETVGSKTPFLLYFAVVILVARYLGNGVALFASLLTTLAADFFFFPPYYSFHLSGGGAIQILVFLLECYLLALISSSQDKAARKISDHQKMFRTLIEKGTDGIMMVKLDGKIIYSSPSVERITGYRNEEFNGQDLWSFLIPESLTDVKEKFYQIASHPGRSEHFLHQLKHKNGHVIWVESTVTNLINEPLVKSLIVNFTDVTDRVVREKQMEDFVGIASHELKTPLTSLKAYTQVLEMRMRKENNTTSAVLVNKIDKQIDRVVAMIFDLLDVTKMQTGIMSLNLSLFNISDLVQEVSDGFQNGDHGHEIAVNAEPDVQLRGDKTRISQVLNNLISNAIKYSPEARAVDVSLHREGNFVKVCVKDYGIGIPENEVKNVFKRFYRVEEVRESFQGLGLGLYISHQIIERHGGQMGVISEVNQGSQFWFTLPIS